MNLASLLTPSPITSSLLNEQTNRFFDSNAHNHDYNKKPYYYTWVQPYVEKYAPLKVLDVGCGTGAFIKEIVKFSPQAEITGIDPSKGMIKIAKEQLPQVKFHVMDGFEVSQSFQGQHFDLIHIDSVLHHLIAPTRGQSKRLASRLLEELSKLTDHLVVGEIFYNSWLIEGFTSGLIFYGLKFAKALHIDLHHAIKDYKLGLETNFFSENALKRSLSRHGEIEVLRRHLGASPFVYRLFGMKEAGFIAIDISVGNKMQVQSL
jgi:SAM-dependent methyltransferase